MEGSDEMISDLWDLCEELGDIYLDRDGESILSSHKAKLFNGKNLLEHVTEPTELFARAFSVYALESSEQKYQTNLSKGSVNFSLKEMDKFKSKMDSLCSKLKEHLIEKEKQKNPNYQTNLNGKTDLLNGLNKEQQVFLLKNEERLFLKSSGKRSTHILKEDYEQANLANADMETNATAFRNLYKKI